MKELKQYVCEKCGTVYADKNACQECEKQHATPVKIVGSKHYSKKVCSVYPYKLIIEFDNGRNRTYELKRDEVEGWGKK